MANKQRHVYGNSEPREAPVLAATVIEVGDLLWFDATNNCAKPASLFTWTTDLATTQGNFKDVFLGVAQSAHLANGPETTVRFSTRGSNRFDCAAAAFDMGVFVGPADSGSSTLMNQKVVAVANATLGIAKPSKQYSSAVTEVFVDIESTIVHSGVQTVT
ncbi:MAG: hypothetical protein EKK55_01120 [Rhodocyclaceae bacterium]|nr:MAG: hypothetical protein EKK55_01120 [Rhodocyclaceae bacterium]